MGTYKINGALQVTTAPTGDNDVVRLNELNDKINYTDINNGLTVVDGKVKANIAKIQDTNSTEFTPDENGVVTIPRATNDHLGLFSSKGYLGLDVFGNVGYYLVPASPTEITDRKTNVWKTIQPRSINKAVKAALTDDKRIGTETGTGDWDSNTAFSDTEKDRACEILGASRKLYAHKVVIRLVNSSSNTDFTLRWTVINDSPISFSSSTAAATNLAPAGRYFNFRGNGSFTAEGELIEASYIFGFDNISADRYYDAETQEVTYEWQFDRPIYANNQGAVVVNEYDSYYSGLTPTVFSDVVLKI